MLYGGPFGVLMGSLGAHRTHRFDAVEGLITVVFTGVLFELAMGWMTQRQRAAREQRTAAFTAGLTARSRTMALRASWRGPIPEDPATRAAAAAMFRYQLERTTSQRSRSLSP